MRSTEIFMIENEGSRYEGNIYSVGEDEKQALIDSGKAVPLNLPTLTTLENKVRDKVASADAKIKELKESKRYDDNEAEREYQIQEVEDKLSAEVEAIREEYELETATLSQVIADDIFDVDYGTEEEREKASDLIRTVKTQIQSTHDKKDILDLLAERTKGMTQAEQAALAAELPSIEAEALHWSPKKQALDIKAGIAKVRANIGIKSVQDAMMQKRQLDAYMRRGAIDTIYQLRQAVKGGR